MRPLDPPQCPYCTSACYFCREQQGEPACLDCGADRAEDCCCDLEAERERDGYYDE